MKKLIQLLLLVTVGLLCPLLAAAAEPGNDKVDEKQPLRAAIFVQNRAGAVMQDQLDVLNDQLTTGLTERGFSVIDKSVVIAKFRESREQDVVLNQKLKTLEEALTKKSEGSVEDAVTGASALRIAQMLGADYLVVATINSLGQETRSFKGTGTGYGTDNHSVTYNLRISLKVLEANQGGSVYGDTVTASERKVLGQGLEVSSTDMIPSLVESGAKKIADNLAGKMERIRTVTVKSVPVVEFTINTNIEGAVVELDGAVIGSTPGHFGAAPGLHQIKISKEWLSTWERTVNITQNQVLSVSLELSEEGVRRYASVEQLKAEMAYGKQRNDMAMKEREAGIGIAKEQSEASAYATKTIAEGQKKKLEESYERLQGYPTTTVVAPGGTAYPAGAVNPTGAVSQPGVANQSGAVNQAGASDQAGMVSQTGAENQGSGTIPAAAR